jgi:hypothetical protein
MVLHQVAGYVLWIPAAGAIIMALILMLVSSRLSTRSRVAARFPGHIHALAGAGPATGARLRKDGPARRTRPGLANTSRSGEHDPAGEPLHGPRVLKLDLISDRVQL